MINSYASIYNLGHAAIVDLLKYPVIVEEKIDGSQISFRKTETGELEMRSKGAVLNILAPEGMFARGVASVQSRADRMCPGYVYRGEYLNAPHHNALTYSRIPVGNIILFDVQPALETYISPEEKKALAEEIGLECVPVLFDGIVSDVNQFRQLLETESVLGGQKIEGMVIKPKAYDLFGKDKKVLMGKFVSEAFREIHSQTWEKEHKTHGSADILQILSASYGTAARWQKALIHLKERGLIQNDPRDIGQLMKEVPEDVARECEQAIKDDLYKWAWPQLRRIVGRGLPEWYKEQLLKKQFEQ